MGGKMQEFSNCSYYQVPDVFRSFTNLSPILPNLPIFSNIFLFLLIFPWFFPFLSNCFNLLKKKVQILLQNLPTFFILSAFFKVFICYSGFFVKTFHFFFSKLCKFSKYNQIFPKFPLNSPNFLSTVPQIFPIFFKSASLRKNRLKYTKFILKKQENQQ